MKNHRNNDGYFLLEVVAALSIIIFFMTGILTVILGASSVVIKTRKRVEQIIEHRNIRAAGQYSSNE